MDQLSTLTQLNKEFEIATRLKCSSIAVLIQMKDFEKPELIINENANFNKKLEYYNRAYNEDLTLKACKDIKIIGCYYGDDLINKVKKYL